MRKSKFTPDQIVRTLREAEQQRAAGKTIAEVCHGFGIDTWTPADPTDRVAQRCAVPEVVAAREEPVSASPPPIVGRSSHTYL